MLSLLVLVRDTRAQAQRCLESLIDSVAAAGLNGRVEYLLGDDASEPASAIPELFAAFRRLVREPVRVLRFKTNQHYVRGVAYLMSLARGDSLLFFSHDMTITPTCLTTMVTVSALFDAAGLVRPASGHMDASQNAVKPALPFRTREDVWSFSRLMERYYGTTAKTEGTLIGDAMLIRRDVIDRIGYFDPRYFGLFGDIDYGIRARHVGYEVLTASGAWLDHSGAGHFLESFQRGKAGPLEKYRKLYEDQYEVFRQKWDPSLPDDPDEFSGLMAIELGKRGPKNGRIFEPPAKVSADVVEIS